MMITMKFLVAWTLPLTLLLLLILLDPVSSWGPSPWTLADRLAGWTPFRRPHRVVASSLSASSATTGSRNLQSSSRRRPSSTSSSTGATMSTKQHYQEMVDFLDTPMDSSVGDNLNDLGTSSSSSAASSFASSSSSALALEDVHDLVRTIVRAADMRKAEHIVALQVHAITTLTCSLVILSGNSRPQNSAIAAAIVRDVSEQFAYMKPGGNGVPEGSAESGWMLLDYGSVMVHIMTPKSHLFYNIEGQWRAKGAVEFDISDCLIPNTAVHEAQSRKLYSPDNEDDPFWS